MLAEEALVILRTTSPYGAALENHCLRLAEISLALAQKHEIEADEDLLRAGCFLHDIGLCVKDPEHRNYLERGLAFARPHAETWGLEGERLKIFEDVMLFNHSLKEVAGIHPQAELVRLAVHVEHSLGQIDHGLERTVVKPIFKKHPRLDFTRVLFEFFKTVMLEDGPTEIFRVFLPVGILSPLSNR